MVQRLQKPAVYVFTTSYHPFIGGAEIAAAEVIRRLKDSYRFFVFTTRFEKALPAREEKDGITVIRLGWGSAFDKFFVPWLGVREMRKLIRQERPVLAWAVMVTFASGIPYLFNLFSRRKIPIVLTLQEGDPVSHLRFGQLGLLGISWFLALRQASAVTAISTYLEAVSRRFGYHGEVRTIPNGVDLARFDIESREEPAVPTVITTSRLVKKNGVDTLILAIAEVKKVVPRVRCVIIGDGPERKKLEELTRRLKLEAEVQFIGKLPHADIPKHLEGASLFVRPSRSEGMGISFVEALAAGLPVIGTPVGGILDVIQDGVSGLFAHVDDPKDLSEKILLLLQNRELAKTLAEKGRKMVQEKFSWDTIAESYRAVFRGAQRSLRLLIATGVYPPAIGGPAYYAKNLEHIFRERGWTVQVFTYSKSSLHDPVVKVSLTIPSGARHIFAFFTALRLVLGADTVLLLDHFSIGFPTALAAYLLRRPYFLRIGGDFLWEQYVERHRREMTLPDFYLMRPRLSAKEKLIFSFSRWVMQHAAEVVFSSVWLRDIFLHAYGLKPQEVTVIANVEPSSFAENSDKSGDDFVYGGRFLFLKNLERMALAFDAARRDQARHFRLRLIGEGPEMSRLSQLIRERKLTDVVTLEPPISQEELKKVLAQARAAVLVSFSDVTPNIVLETLRVGTPVIVTEYTSYDFREEDGVLRVNPFDAGALEKSFRGMMDSEQYQILKQGATHPRPASSWEKTADRYEALIRSRVSGNTV